MAELRVFSTDPSTHDLVHGKLYGGRLHPIQRWHKLRVFLRWRLHLYRVSVFNVFLVFWRPHARHLGDVLGFEVAELRGEILEGSLRGASLTIACMSTLDVGDAHHDHACATPPNFFPLTSEKHIFWNTFAHLEG